MSRRTIPTATFVLVVVRDGDRFLLIQEAKHGNSWYVPAGGVEPGETLSQAARRETREEAGIPVTLEGVLRVEYGAMGDGMARQRVVFVGRAASTAPPKRSADAESLRADWFTREEAERLPLRGDDVLELIDAVESGAPILPITSLLERGG